MSRAFLRPAKGGRKLVKRKYSKISRAEIEHAVPDNHTQPAAPRNDNVQEYRRPRSPSPSSSSDTKLLPAVDVDSPQGRLKESVSFWIARAKARVAYAIEMYRINKVLGPEFDY